MAGSVNKVILLGNLGADPEIREFPSGAKYCRLRMATSERWRDRNTGENREQTEWHNITIFNENLVRIAEQYLRRGEKVYIEGKLETRKWTDQQGQDRFSTEIAVRFGGQLCLLGARADPTQSSGSSYGGSQGYRDQSEKPARSAVDESGSTNNMGAKDHLDDDDDDIPF